jgi:predicted nucleotidyltransferase component of viral defense system
LKFTIPIKENRHCYASTEQLEILFDLINHKIPGNSFFLTGGTALAVFYLHHRTSNDLDFFTLDNIDISEIDFRLKSIWGKDYTKLKESDSFLSLLMKNVKIDFIIDPLSFKEERKKTKSGLLLDTINNIYSNKLAAIVSRNEPKDYIDFYFIHQRLQKKSLDGVYKDASRKDAIFDDPPSAAYQIEEGIHFIRSNRDLIPNLLVEINWMSFYTFYTELIEWIYKKIILK